MNNLWVAGSINDTKGQGEDSMGRSKEGIAKVSLVGATLSSGDKVASIMVVVLAVPPKLVMLRGLSKGK